MIKKWFLISLIGIILLAFIAACTQTASLNELDDAQVEALVIEKCSECHTADLVFQADFSETQWSATFNAKYHKDVDVTADEKDVMINWLVSRNQ